MYIIENETVFLINEEKGKKNLAIDTSNTVHANCIAILSYTNLY
jgi:hypothetical protein